jgi:hypothetical protein
MTFLWEYLTKIYYTIKKNETFIKIGKQEKITKKIFIFPIQIRNNFIIQLKEKIEEDKIKIFLNCFESKIPLINQ